MNRNNRDERDQQLREPEPGSTPAKDLENSPASLESGPLEGPGRQVEDAAADKEAEVTGAAVAVRPLSGLFQANSNNLEAAGNISNTVPKSNSELINRNVVNTLSAQTDANREEEAIVARVLAGDTEAFAELIDRYKVAVYNLCARMLNDPTEAEDAAQEVFVRAYTQLHSYQPGRRFSTWILSIASHYCIDLLRRRKPSVDLEAIAFWKQSDQPEPEEQALTVETRDEVRQLLSKLPDKYRGVTVLRYWQDLSYEEIAEATGLSVATVKTRLFRARELLAKELEKQRQSGTRQGQEEPKARNRSLLKKNRTVNSNVK